MAPLLLFGFCFALRLWYFCSTVTVTLAASSRHSTQHWRLYKAGTVLLVHQFCKAPVASSAPCLRLYRVTERWCLHQLEAGVLCYEVSVVGMRKRLCSTRYSVG
jgi:hypothetical protein